jgi:hypothetical protein
VNGTTRDADAADRPMLDPLESLTAKCTRQQDAKLEAKGGIRQIFTLRCADVGVTPTGEAGLTGVLVPSR